MRLRRLSGAALFLAIAVLSLAPGRVRAHCDSMDGPVIHDARRALDTGDPTPVLKWVSQEHEAEIRDAFARTLAVRGTGDEVKALVDRYFFETLVRIHRAGEGEAFTGLKAASGVDPGVAAADKALQSGSATELATHMSTAVGEGIRRRFAVALERRKHVNDSLEAGRAYVEAYVDFIHFVESINRLTTHGASHLHHEPAAHAE